jgi:hypothetical protein
MQIPVPFWMNSPSVWGDEWASIAKICTVEVYYGRFVIGQEAVRNNRCQCREAFLACVGSADSLKRRQYTPVGIVEDFVVVEIDDDCGLASDVDRGTFVEARVGTDKCVRLAGNKYIFFMLLRRIDEPAGTERREDSFVAFLAIFVRCLFLMFYGHIVNPILT